MIKLLCLGTLKRQHGYGRNVLALFQLYQSVTWADVDKACLENGAYDREHTRLLIRDRQTSPSDPRTSTQLRSFYTSSSLQHSPDTHLSPHQTAPCNSQL